MKKYAPPTVQVRPAILLMISVILCFVILSCNKKGAFPPQQEVAKLCPITRISFEAFAGGPRDTITFLYDWLGRPVNSIRTDVGTGSPRYVFRYDDRGRVQDFIGAYGASGNFGAEFWNRYTYSDDNRTVVDTTYTLVLQDTTWPPPTYFGDHRWAIRKYDQQGRVIQITTPIYPPIVLPDTIITEGTENYTYDTKGNLVNGGTYDDKINYHRTNPVWQFVDDQYSNNNPIPIDRYDVLGLPIRFDFNLNGVFPYPSLFGLQYPGVVIEYGCELPQTSNQKE